MSNKLEIYRCAVCGNIVEVLHGGKGELACCGQPMERLLPHTGEGPGEKHIPVTEEAPGGLRVKVGSIPHPMEKEHHIEWIQVISGGDVYRRFLEPGEEPEALFKAPAGKPRAREYCNVHGLWETGADAE